MVTNSLTERLCIKYPIVQAPMAGGITTTDLVVAVSKEGGLGSIGAGYMSATLLQRQVQEIKSLTEKNFAVNLFVPQPFAISEEAVAMTYDDLSLIYDQLQINGSIDISLPTYEEKVTTYKQQIDIVIKERVPIVSFTFGLPSKQVVKRLHEVGTVVMATATTVHEALEIERLGIDVVIAQGSEAGGHRGNFLQQTEDSLIGLISLIPQIKDNVDLPLIAAGGIMDGRGIVAALTLGASAVQMGTAFLTTEESGAHRLYKQAVLQADESTLTLTDKISGKYARGIRNELIDKLAGGSGRSPDYPIQNTLTQEIRKEAQRQDNVQYMSLWSGQSPRLARHEKVRILMQRLIKETDDLLNIRYE